MAGKYTAAFSASMAEAHKFPTGWDTREQVAVDMGCSVDRVRDLIAPLVKAGTVERREFKVWDASRGQVSRQTGYRIVAPKPAAGGKRAT